MRLLRVYRQTVPVANKTYAQWCPVSRALDVVGERWTLLIVRDLGLGVRRFSELQADLVGISPSLLSGRLRQLTEAGVIERERAQYRLTERGTALLEVVAELGRWGLELMPDRYEVERRSTLQSRSVLRYLVSTDRLPDHSFTVEFQLDDGVHTLDIAPPEQGLRPHHRVSVVAGPVDRSVDVRVTGSIDLIAQYRRGVIAADVAFADHGLTLDGDERSADLVTQLFAPG